MTAFSPAETEALRQLESFGFDFAPAYIGRARKHFVEAGRDPNAEEIIDQVLVMQAADGKTPVLVQITETEYREFNQLRAIDHELSRDLAAILRELVEQERAAMPAAGPLAALNGKIRLTLHPEKIARPGTDQGYTGTRQISGKRLIFKAWVNPDFVNLEIAIN